MASVATISDLNAVKGFKIVHLNVRSITKKIDQLRILLQDSSVNIFTFSETWLRPFLHSALFEIDGYKLFRQDREIKNKRKKRGGGLLTYIKNEHLSSSEQLDELNTSNGNIEAQWTLIHRPFCKNVVVGNLYRPPNGNLAKAVEYLDNSLKTMNLGKMDVFLVGDLNVNFQDKTSSAFKKLNFFIQSNGLSQHILNSTRNTDKSQSLIDIAISNSKFVSGSGTLDHHISDHLPIFIVHKKGKDKRDKADFKGRSYRDFDKVIFEEKLLSCDWAGYYDIEDPTQSWEFVHQHITSILDEMCPVKTFHIKNYRPEWMTNELIEMIKDRDYFYKKAKRSGDTDAWNIAKFLRNVTNSYIRSSKREFVLNELKENDNNVKKFWKTIRKVVPSNKSTTDCSILLKDNGEKIEKGQVATYINDFFINVGKRKRPSELTPANNINNEDLELDIDMGEPDCSTEPELDRGFDQVTEKEVYRTIKNINISKSSGIDSMSSFVLKEAFTILVPVMTRLFNQSLTTGVFPTQWKKALVIPIPKTGSLSNVQNYRPISLLPLPGKILEKLIHCQLSSYLEEKSLLTEKQHGFRKSHSTLHSVSQLTNFVNNNLDIRRPTLAAFIDFRKAFDCVQHDVLLKKLGMLGLDISVLRWVESYLQGREQRVYANNVYSEFLNITQGVPQGSVLGPLFYILYANDLSTLFKNCDIALYADDTVLYTVNDNFQDSVSDLQQDMDRLTVWCDKNGIMVNTNKTKIMVFGSKTLLNKLPTFEIKCEGLPLPVVTSYKYLGVTLDYQLNYNLHIKKLISSVSAKLKQFQKMRSFLSIKAAVMVYKNMLLPIIEYGDIFLTAASLENRRKLQTLQNKGLRCALNKGIETDSADLHKEASLLKLKYRREQHILNFVFDWSLDRRKLKSSTASSIVTRSQVKKLFKVKKPHTEKYKRSLAYRGLKKWNKLPVHFHKTASKAEFKMLVEKRMVARAEANTTLINVTI